MKKKCHCACSRAKDHLLYKKDSSGKIEILRWEIFACSQLELIPSHMPDLWLLRFTKEEQGRGRGRRSLFY